MAATHVTHILLLLFLQSHPLDSCSPFSATLSVSCASFLLPLSFSLSVSHESLFFGHPSTPKTTSPSFAYHPLHLRIIHIYSSRSQHALRKKKREGRVRVKFLNFARIENFHILFPRGPPTNIHVHNVVSATLCSWCRASSKEPPCSPDKRIKPKSVHPLPILRISFITLHLYTRTDNWNQNVNFLGNLMPKRCKKKIFSKDKSIFIIIWAKGHEVLEQTYQEMIWNVSLTFINSWSNCRHKIRVLSSRSSSSRPLISKNWKKIKWPTSHRSAPVFQKFFFFYSVS